jgi:hypothetical protein
MCAGDRGQLGHLMPPRLARLIARVQHPLAVVTCVRDEIDDGVYARDGHQRSRVA